MVVPGGVQRHLESWLAGVQAGELDGLTVPAYIERDFRRSLSCGVLAHSFGRAHCASCGHDFLVPFSCKGRGLCPSCNTRRMAETAAHLVDHVFPRVPVRQWVFSLPKRLRYFLLHDAERVNQVLRVFLEEVEKALLACTHGAPAGARFGAVSFVHRFGAALNSNLHFHCCVIEGLFSTEGERLRFHPAKVNETAIARVQRQTHRRGLRLFRRRALLAPEAVEAMQEWEHGGGFSLHAEVRVSGHNRGALERLLRYCARPVFASERLAWLEPD